MNFITDKFAIKGKNQLLKNFNEVFKIVDGFSNEKK